MIQDFVHDYAVAPQSLYIHWPFCPYRCSFCPFVALSGHDEFMDEYHRALIEEIRMFFAKTGPCAGGVQTIYLGGGTPSTYPPALLLDTFDILKNDCGISPDAEITIEVNPGTVSPEAIEAWKVAGINRISLGVQGLDDAVLQKLGRNQTVQQVEEALGSMCASFSNVSVDLILGLPGVSFKQWKATVERIVQWSISHISIYFLTVHEDTRLYFQVRRGAIALPNDDAMVTAYHWTCSFLSAQGFEQYELSNFARPGCQSRHNTAYWERIPYRGFGLGACSFNGLYRFQNEKNLMRYFERIKSAEMPISFSEVLAPDQVQVELLMLGLRRSVGVEQAVIERGLSDQQRNLFRQRIGEMKKEGILWEFNDRLRLTATGMVLENQVIARLAAF